MRPTKNLRSRQSHPGESPYFSRSAGDRLQRQCTRAVRHSDIVWSKAVKLDRALESMAVSAAAATISAAVGPSGVCTQSPEGPLPASTTRNKNRRILAAWRAVSGPYGVSADNLSIVNADRP